MAEPSGVISTSVPARLERLPWGRFHVLVVAALGITWILDGLEVTLAGSVAGALKQSPALHFTDAEVGLAGSAYLLGAVIGALFFGWLTDRLRAQEAVLHHPRRLSVGDGADRPLLGRLRASSSSASSPAAASAANIRRSIRPSRSCPGALSRLHRSRDQRQLLGRRGGSARWRGRAARSRRFDARSRLAPRLPARRGARPRRVPHAHLDSRKPALARHPRPRRRKPRRRSPRSSASRGRRRAAAAARSDQARCALRTRATHADRARSSRHSVRRNPSRTLVGADADGGAGVLLQRDLLHLRAGADQFYGVASADVGWYILPFAAGNFLGPAAARPSVRHPRPARDDRLTYALSGLLLFVCGVLFQATC